MSLKELAEMEQVMNTIVEAAEEGQKDIFAIAEDAHRSQEDIEKQLYQLREEVARTIHEVDLLSEQERLARQRLMEVSRNFDKYSELDIKFAYDDAWQLQVKLSVMREKEQGLLQRRNDLERQLADITSVVTRGESMVERLGLVVSLLKGQAESFLNQLRVSEQRQVFALWILQAQEEERHKIARELHDGPAQNMAALIMKLEYLERTCLDSLDRDRLPGELSLVRQGIRDNLADIRRIIFDLRPPQLETRGLVGCITDYISEFESRYGVTTTLRLLGLDPAQEPLAEPLEFTVFRVIQEALNNVARHSGASEALISFEVTKENVNLIIKDNGCGFDVKAIEADTSVNHGFGLPGMRERVGLLGGQLEVQSSKGRGTRVVARIPRT